MLSHLDHNVCGANTHPVHLHLVSVGLRLRARRLLHVLGGRRVQVRRAGGAPRVVAARRRGAPSVAATVG